MKIGKYQFIWWGYWIGIKRKEWDDPYHRYVLSHSYNIGLFEIRVWR